MNFMNDNYEVLPAEEVTEVDTAVIITYGERKTVINNAAVIGKSDTSENIAYVKLITTKLGVIVEPVYKNFMAMNVDNEPSKLKLKKS